MLILIIMVAVIAATAISDMKGDTNDRTLEQRQEDAGLRSSASDSRDLRDRLRSLKARGSETADQGRQGRSSSSQDADKGRGGQT